MKVFCRLCMTQCNQNCNSLYGNESDRCLNNLITKYLGIEVNHDDHYSTKVCLGCVQMLNAFHDFCRMVKENQNLLETEALTLSNIKNEPPDNAYIFTENVQESQLKSTEPIDPLTHLNISDNHCLGDSLCPTETQIFVKNEIESDEEDTHLVESTRFAVTKAADVEELHHEHGVKSLKCRICRNEATNFEDAKNHLQQYHNIPLKHVYVTCCGLRFYSQRPYDEHRKAPPNQFRCDVCNKQLLSEKTLRFHKLAKHTDRKEYKLSCEICGEKFLFLCALKQHISTHTSKKPHKCDICGSSYARLSYLRSHRARHTAQQLKTKRVYDCETCNKEFSCLENFRLHLILTDENDCLQSKARPIERDVVFTYKIKNECCICKKDFSKKNILRKHLEVHIRRKKLTHLFEALETTACTLQNDD